MIQKRFIRPERLRQVPPSFNWVDHRLVRDHYIERCDCTRWRCICSWSSSPMPRA